MVIATCKRQDDGSYVAPELAEGQTLERLYAFGDKLRMVYARILERRKRCLHQVHRLPKKDRPWRYRCELCGQQQKILSGVNLDTLRPLAGSRGRASG